MLTLSLWLRGFMRLLVHGLGVWMLEAGSRIGHDSLSLVTSLRVYCGRVLLLGQLDADVTFFRSTRPSSEVGRAHHLLAVTGRWMSLPRTRTS